MNKVAIFLTLAVVAGYVSFQMIERQPDLTVTSWAEDQANQDKITAYRCFKETFDAAIEDLRGGSVQLKEAQLRVLAAARHYHPDFLVHLCLSEPGATHEERVARNLVEHVVQLEEFAPHAGRCGELTRQLQELIVELHSRYAARA